MSQLEWNTITDFHDAPGTCGVYQYWQNDDLLYIGKAINLKARLSSHAQNAKLDAKEAAIVAGNIIKYTICDSEFKALMLEAALIRTLKPPHNRAWKDDKSYLYIVIDQNDPYPRPYFARAHDLKITNNQALNSKIRIFGPFPNSKIAEEVLRAIRRLVPFCMAKKVGKHACFYSRIGLCSPCPANIIKLEDGKTTTLQKRIYRNQIRHVIKILDGEIEPVIKDLMDELKAASLREDYESALTIRTKIERFERFISTHNFTDRHFSYNNASAKLEILREALSPYLEVGDLSRIECYDASNSALHDSVVSLTVMTDGLLNNGEYRRFKIKNPRAVSDFDRLDEAMTRRLKNKSWPSPNLIVIDGGVPQLRRLQRIFDKLEIPLNYIGLAKHPDRLILPGDSRKASKYITIKLASEHPGLQLLQQLRDEAHRFANAYRKILAKKRTRL